MIVNLEHPEFQQETLDTLFEYILLDDVVHPNAYLPGNCSPVYQADEIENAYRICWQLFYRSFDAGSFRTKSRKLLLSSDIDPTLFKSLKHVRACIKQLRLVRSSFTIEHSNRGKIGRFSLYLGNFLDAIKNRKRLLAMKYYIRLLFCVTKRYLIQLKQEAERFDAITPTGYQQWLAREYGFIADKLWEGKVTSVDFHTMRKIINRRIACNDNIRAISPSKDLDALSAVLATLNALMGDYHDVLIKQRLHKQIDYDNEKISIPEHIVEHLTAFLQKVGIANL